MRASRDLLNVCEYYFAAAYQSGMSHAIFKTPWPDNSRVNIHNDEGKAMYNGMLCGMSAFKAHCAFGFWKGSLIFPGSDQKDSMGHFGRLTSVKDLPSKKALAGYLKQAMRLNEEGVTTPARTTRPAPHPLAVPDYFAAAPKAREAAKETFDTGSTSFKREYVDWLEDAKTEATRLRRMEQAVQRLAEGKGRNWKYEKC